MAGGDNRRDDGREPGTLFLTIVPEPTGDERDAVVAALAVLNALRTYPAPVRLPPSSRWANTGRRAALRGVGNAIAGWGRSPGGHG